MDSAVSHFQFGSHDRTTRALFVIMPILDVGKPIIEPPVKFRFSKISHLDASRRCIVHIVRCVMNKDFDGESI